MESKIYNQNGKETGKIALPADIFGLTWNADLVHEVVTSMMSNMRDPIAHTKTRGEVSGTGKKPWQQKGTGRARHGSRRSPIWVGGGVAHGPRNDKNYSRKINKKAKTKALFTILSRKAKDGEILFIDSLNFDKPKTKEAKIIMTSLAGVKGFEKLSTKPKNVAMFALPAKSDSIQKSFQNFGNVTTEDIRNINPVSVMNYKYLIISSPEESLKVLMSKISSNEEVSNTKKFAKKEKTEKTEVKKEKVVKAPKAEKTVKKAAKKTVKENKE